MRGAARGVAKGLPRHAAVEDGVTIHAGAAIRGCVAIGR